MRAANGITPQGWRRKGAWAALACVLLLPFALAVWNVSEVLALRSSAADMARLIRALSFFLLSRTLG